MAQARKSSRRKSSVGGLDEEEKKLSSLVERSRRRKSESGTADLLEHRRILKELEEKEAEDQGESEDEDDESQKAAAEGGEEEEEEEEEGDDSSSDDSDSSDSEVDEDEQRAMEAAMSSLLANSSETTKVKRRRQRQGLNAKSDPSPYLNKLNGVVQVRNNTLVDRRKGSSIDIEALANQSKIYQKNKVSESQKPVAKTNIVTSGAGWFNLPATEMTEELKQDLRAVRMRGALDPKRFYKALDRPSKFVQIGTIIEGRDEYYSSRLTRKERRTNLVDELMADEKTRQYTKRKFGSIQNDKQNKKRFGPRKKNPKNFGTKPKKN
jgi:hypothetical protein